MRLRNYILYVLVILSLPCIETKAQLLINEFVASNSSGGYYDAVNDNYPDWIEIFNNSDSEIDLGGYYLTDDLDDLNKWKIAEGTNIAARGFLLFLADDLDTANHANFKLNAEGESIGLSNGEKILLDSVVYMPQRTNISMGRTENNLAAWAYFPEPTPNARNSTTAYTGKALAPVLSEPAGFYEQAVIVEMVSPIETASIRYTLDGSSPTEYSAVYSAPVTINSNTVVKAICVEDGQMTSDVVSHTYFIGEHTTLPVFSFSMSPSKANAFPFESENDAHVEYFDQAKTQIISQNIGVRITGLVGIHPMRTFSLYARTEYGNNRLDHRFFKDKTITSFKNLVLRNGGYQDYSYTYLRDGLIQSFVIDNLDLDYQAYQPVIVYKNGEYLALMNMREKLNEFYVEGNNHVDKDSIDFLEYQTDPPIDVLMGDADHFTAMMDFIENSDLTQQGNMEYLETQMDVKNYLDYYMLQIYCANADWPDKNCKIWRPKKAGGKWRWMIFDVDYGYGFRFPVETNMYEYLYQLEEPFYHNRPWVTVIFRKIMENEGARNYYLQRFNALLNTTFHTERALFLVDSLKAQIEPEIGRHIDLWGAQPYGIPSMDAWQSYCDTLYEFAHKRPQIARMNMMNFYNLEDTVSIKVKSEGGTVYLNNLAYCKDSIEGKFFKNIPIQLKAVPDPGYRFEQWLDLPDSLSSSLSFTAVSDTNIVAIFSPISANILKGVFERDTVLSDTSEAYISTGHLVIPAHTKVLIEEGVRLLMPEACNIYVYGTLIIHGTEVNPVLIDAYSGSWGGICLNHSTGKSQFDHLVIKNATTGGDPELYKGAISAYFADMDLSNTLIKNVPANGVYAQYSNVSVNACQFQSDGTCDLINVKYADTAIVENSVFKDSKMADTDAIDFDDVRTGIIRNNKIYNLIGENSDGIDIGEGASNVEIYENLIVNCSDKGISLGQASSMSVYRNVLYSCGNGIAVKDFGSSAMIYNNTLVDNAIGISCYEKNLGSGSGTANVLNTILADSKISSLIERNGGEIFVEYSLSNTDLLFGAGNLYDDPALANPGLLNFELLPGSPCINTGNPDSPLDSDGSRADMGAYFVSNWPETHEDLIINEFYSNSSFEDPQDWIEIYNKSKSGIDLSGWYILDGGNNYFRIPDDIYLDSSSYMVICKDTSDFKNFFGSVTNLCGNFDFSLGIARDEISLFNEGFNPVKHLRYDENNLWPESKEKLWLSVALIDTSLSATHGINWRTGYKIYGTPGYSNIPPRISGLYLNEICGGEQTIYADNFGEYEDWLELYNSGENEVNFGGLYLTDDLKNLCKSRIPQNKPDSTIIASKGFQVLIADGEPEQGVLHLDFRISSSGEELGLIQLVGLDTAILDQVIFGEFSLGNSIGRRTDGGTPWEKQRFTPGSSNYAMDTEKYDEFSVSVYPVPANNILYLSLPETVEGQVDIQMVNALGQIVKSEGGIAFVPGQLISMDVSFLQEGVYFLKIRGGDSIFVKQIIISR